MTYVRCRAHKICSLVHVILCSKRCLERFLWDRESANDVCGRLHDLDVQCVSTRWVDELAAGGSVHESQTADGARGFDYSFEYSRYLTGGLSLPDASIRFGY